MSSIWNEWSNHSESFKAWLNLWAAWIPYPGRLELEMEDKTLGIRVSHSKYAQYTIGLDPEMVFKEQAPTEGWNEWIEIQYKEWPELKEIELETIWLKGWDWIKTKHDWIQDLATIQNLESSDLFLIAQSNDFNQNGFEFRRNKRTQEMIEAVQESLKTLHQNPETRPLYESIRPLGLMKCHGYSQEVEAMIAELESMEFEDLLTQGLESKITTPTWIQTHHNQKWHDQWNAWKKEKQGESQEQSETIVSSAKAKRL